MKGIGDAKTSRSAPKQTDKQSKTKKKIIGLKHRIASLLCTVCLTFNQVSNVILNASVCYVVL